MRTTKDTREALAALAERSTSLQKEFHLRADALDADVAALAKLLPTRLFKMRVRTTRWARTSILSHAVVVAVALGFASVVAKGLVSDPRTGLVLATASVFAALLALLVGAIGALASVSGPLPWKARATVYVRHGDLSVVEGWSGTDLPETESYWKRKTCSRLLDEDDVVLASLFSELQRGVDTYFARLDVLDAAREAVAEQKTDAERRAQVQAEVSRA